MDFAFVVRQRLEKLGIGQRDLASASEVTESYISQLLGRKKLPPLPNRTDIYDKMSGLLGLPREELARLAALQHRDAIDRTWRGSADARFGPMRELLIGKCNRRNQKQMRALFEKDPFGEIERLITRTLVEVVRDEARAHARDEAWLRSIAESSEQSYRKMRVRLIDLLDNDPEASIGDFTLFIEPLVRLWTFDSDAFMLQVRLASGAARTFVFGENVQQKTTTTDPAGLRAFLRDARLSSGVTPEEMQVLRNASVPSANAVFYYRILQNLRDPMNFR